MQSFNPGLNDTNSPIHMPALNRTIDEWTKIFRGFLEKQRPQIPNVVVFNAGLWLVGNYRENAMEELSKMLHAWISLCKEYGIFFVWRSTLYHHRSTGLHRLIRACNDLAINLLVNTFHHPFFIDSVFVMSQARPDRTVDGFHYNYRMLRKAWHRCSDDDFLHNLDPDCIRDMSWPMSVAKTLTLTLVNALFNSDYNLGIGNQ